MRWSPSAKGLFVLGGLALGALLAQARLPDWVRHIEAESPLETIFFREVDLVGGRFPARRPPSETRELLGERIGSQPDRAALYALRARESERALDFTQAERDWRAYAERIDDPAVGQLALADFYDRRLRASDEVEALLAVGRSPAAPEEALRPASAQRSWQAFERIVRTVEEQLLPAERLAETYRAWLSRYPQERAIYERYLEFLLREQRWDAAEQLVDDYAAAFEDAALFTTQARARLARAASGAEAGIGVYEESLDPLSPQHLWLDYFQLLEDADRLRERLDEERATVAAAPDDLGAAAWLFHYYRRQGDLIAAIDTLQQLERAHASGETWEAGELQTLAALFREANGYSDAARCFYALYSLSGAEPADREAALAGLIDVLLTAPERAIRLGDGDFSFYRDIATLDEHPGFWNGILSLLFNTQYLPSQFSYQERLSQPYFRRARAAELLARFDREFPSSSRGPALRARLIEAYGVYGENIGVIREGRAFLSRYEDAPERIEVALRIADALARTGQTTDEFALYDQLLAELSDGANGVPLGEGATETAFRRNGLASGPRSSEYARTLDRYISRLTALNRTTDALGLYARQIAENPNDPGLYEQFASFLEANGFAERVQQVYRQAMRRFDDVSWEHKLARWHLRRRQRAEFASLTREIVDRFSGTDLEEYFRTVTPDVAADAQLYLQLNLYAHRRFPHNLTFVRNLLGSYRRRETADAAAWERLIRRHWFYSDDLRTQYLQHLTRQGKLETTLAEILDGERSNWRAVAAENPPAALLFAEGQAWRCHFEEAAPAFLGLAAVAPVDEPHAGRAAAIHRSLGFERPEYVPLSASLRQALSQHDPADRAALALIGDTLADRALFERAELFWEKMAQTAPGSPQAWLDAASVFWDYFLFDDALRILDQGREALGRPSLFAFEVGAIHEGRSEPTSAIAEYLQGALRGEDRDDQAFQRLVTLSRRDGYRETIEQSTARLVAGAAPSAPALALRAAVLEAQDRDDELADLLARIVRDARSQSTLDEVEQLSQSHGLRTIRAAILERRIELTRDPVTARRLRLDLMRWHESRENLAGADRVVEALYSEQPRILGIVRARVDFLWRHGRRSEAIDALATAAEQAYPELKRQFLFEAVEKATEAELFERARDLASRLLAEEPFEPRYLSAFADTYAREGADEELRDFYEEKLAAVDEADLSPARRRTIRAALRRGIIPALERLGDHAAAIDQYVELINQFPEDRPLIAEAARFAEDHGEQDRLIDFYVRTTETSPRDVRFHRVLAWIYSELKQGRPAVESYAKALAIRPDSAPLWEARTRLLDRQLRFEEALEGYERLYELSYQDPRWMAEIAKVQSRLGNTEAAVGAIRTARIEGRPARPAIWANAAAELEGWGLLGPAAEFADQAVELAGPALLRNHGSTATTYLRIMTRLRRYDQAFRRIRPPAIESGDARMYSWRLAVREMALAARRDFTSEERTAFADFLDEAQRTASSAEFREALLPAIRSADLAKIESLWLLIALRANPANDADRQRFIELQSRRMQHRELGTALVEQWRAHPLRNQRRDILAQAADALRSAGATDEEFRALELLGQPAERYLELLLERDPERLVSYAASGGPLAQPAADYAMARGPAELARRAIEAYGAAKRPVWPAAYIGLAGLFHGAAEAPFQSAFERALGGGTVGERLAAAVDRDLQLAGSLWFAYAERYGRFLARDGAANADDFLPAELEASPATWQGYFRVGEFYRETGDPAAARDDLERALALAPNEPRIRTRLADVAWSQDDRETALAYWRGALKGYTRQAAQSRFDSSFWTDVPALIARLGQEGLFEPLRESIFELLQSFVRRNGAYRSEELLRPAMGVAENSEAFARVLSLGGSAPNPAAFFEMLARARWLTLSQRLDASSRAVDLAGARWEQADPERRYGEQHEFNQARIRRLELLLEAEQSADAQAIVERSEEAFRQTLFYQEPVLLVRTAAAADRVASLFEDFQSFGEIGAASLQQAARRLREEGLAEEADELLEFFYQRKIAQRDERPAYFLGLAELRLRQGRSAEAVNLLERLFRSAPEPFSHYSEAGRLLMEFEEFEAAARIFAERVQAAPWDFEARVGAAEARLALNAFPAALEELAAVARHPAASYAIRAKAARAIGAANGEPDLESAELTLLASGDATPARASQPWFYPARLAAAEQASGDELVALLASALALTPGDDDLRLRLLEAAHEAGDRHAAISAARPLFERSAVRYALERVDSVFDESSPEAAAEPWVVESFLNNQGLTGERRANLAAALGDSLNRLGRLGGAATLYQIAVELGGGPTSEQALERIQAERARRAANARRRPVVRDDLDQPNRVDRKRPAGGTE